MQSHNVVLCLIILFCIIIILFCIVIILFYVLLHWCVMIWPCFVCYNDVLCLIMLFCTITILFVCHIIGLCPFMLYGNVTMLQCYNFIINVAILCRILLYCFLVCNNFVLCLVMLFINVIYVYLCYKVVLCLFKLWCGVISLFCILQSCFVSYYIVL